MGKKNKKIQDSPENNTLWKQGILQLKVFYCNNG